MKAHARVESHKKDSTHYYVPFEPYREPFNPQRCPMNCQDD